MFLQPEPQSSTLYIYFIYIELASTQAPFFKKLPSECTESVRNQNKDSEFWLSAHIVRAYPYMELQILRMSKWQVAACSVLSPSKSYIIELRRFWLSAYSDPYKDMRGQYVQITKIRYLCFDLVHSRYTRMAGFGRREIELMQALCIYNIYIEYYSVGGGLVMAYMPRTRGDYYTHLYCIFILQ